ncbi:E3 ubiquitin-protein ligase LRSAM1-like [Oppia nitens]|uniref:E3 ubiquitin-protein ligase LRSAM1-like n=1 Tax=Oppia nitens TaxID=1686743 RepID=UPI0023DC2DFE|nr:E3 ubiquitin-protein ligase LRSAM1-like [Oppia nitens]
MSFLKKLIQKSQTKDNNLTIDVDDNNSNDYIRRKVDKRLVLSQSDPEPILDLNGCQLACITPTIITTIKIYGKTDCRFDDNLLTEFGGTGSLQYMSAVRSLHLSNNRLASIGKNIAQLKQLKELYLSHNQLSQLPDTLAELTALKILSIRDNRFAELPDCITRLAGLTCLDIGDNHLRELPGSLLRLRQLKSLQLDGCPMESPDPGVCHRGLQAIRAYLANNNKMHSNSNEHIDYYGNGSTGADDDDNDDNLLLPSPDDTNGSDTTDIVDSIDAQSPIDYKNYHILKDQKKKALLDWEKQFHTNIETNGALGGGSGVSAGVGGTTDQYITDKKRGLLSQLWLDDRQRSADIHSRQRQKDRDRQSLLNSICELDRHSKQLLDSLNNWEDRHRNQLDAMERDERQLMDHMLRYDSEIVVKKGTILLAMEEMLLRESKALALTDELREYNQTERRKHIGEQEHLQRQAFEALQHSRDYRSRQLTAQIAVVEQELLQLTTAEMAKKDDRLDTILTDIGQQRRQLAAVLAKLLAQKRARDQQLRDRVLEIERRRFESTTTGVSEATASAAANDQEFWLRQYQCLMERQPFSVQMKQLNIGGCDDRLVQLLTTVHSDCDRIGDFVTLFADITYDRLYGMSAEDILALGVNDYDLCQLIRDKLDELGISCTTGAADMATGQPSAPVVDDLLSASELLIEPTAPTESDLTVGTVGADKTLSSIGQLANVKIWRQTECVICFELMCNVVFLPCGHVCSCNTCALLVSTCPLCRVFIDDKLNVNF